LKEPKNIQTSRSTEAKYALTGIMVQFMQTFKPNIRPTHNDNKNNTNIKK